MWLIEGIHWKTSSFLRDKKVVKRRGNKRWISHDGTRYYEWDPLHGEIEVYDIRGVAVGVLSSDGNPSSKQAKSGRNIDV